MKKKLIVSSLLTALMCISICSCDKETIISGVSVHQIQDLGGAGTFKAINMASNDTLFFNGALFDFRESERMTVKNGNIIKLIFEPSAEYSKYKYNTTYTLHNGGKIENEPIYEYAIKNTEKGEYRVYLSAKSTEQDITANASFILNVLE